MGEFDSTTLPGGAEIVRRNIDANGGRTNLNELRSLFAKGVIIAPDETEREFKVYRKRPHQMKTIVNDGKVESVVCFDGKQGWRQISIKGNNEAQKVREVADDELLSLMRSSNFDGPVMQHEDRPENIRAVAFEEIDGEPVIRVEFLGLDPGDYGTGWISTKHFQTIRLARIAKDESAEDGMAEEELSFLDFKKVNGVYVAMRIESRREGQLIQEIRIDEVRPNVGIFDSFFTRP